MIVLLCCLHDFVGLLENILEVKQKFRWYSKIVVGIIVIVVKQIIAYITIPKNVMTSIIIVIVIVVVVVVVVVVGKYVTR